MSIDKKTGIETLVVGGIATNCYIVPLNEREAIVIDPGDNAPRIARSLAERHLTPRFVLLTHGHFDHIAAVPPLFAHYAALGVHPDLLIHEEDASFLGKDAYAAHCKSWRAIAGGDMSFVDALWQDMPEPTRLFDEGATIGPFTALHLPGHSCGSSGFYDEKRGVLISGDTLFAAGVGRTDLPESDDRALERSVKRLLALPPDTVVRPGHGRSTTIGVEASTYGYF